MPTRKRKTKITVVRSNREGGGTKITGIVDNFIPRELRAIINVMDQRGKEESNESCSSAPISSCSLKSDGRIHMTEQRHVELQCFESNYSFL
jgi:hypothetical protein